jgi:hypothetical protein
LNSRDWLDHKRDGTALLRAGIPDILIGLPYFMSLSDFIAPHRLSNRRAFIMI